MFVPQLAVAGSVVMDVVVLRVLEHAMVGFGVVSSLPLVTAWVLSMSSSVSFIDVPGGVIVVWVALAAG